MRTRRRTDTRVPTNRAAHTERICHSCTGAAGRWSSEWLMTALAAAVGVVRGGAVSCDGRPLYHVMASSHSVGSN